MSRRVDTEKQYLFPEYSKQKLLIISDTYEDLSKLYTEKPSRVEIPKNRIETIYRNKLEEEKHIFAWHLHEMSGAVEEVAQTVMCVSVPVEHKKKQLLQYLKKHGIIVREILFLEVDSNRKQINISARCTGNRKVSTEDMAGLLSVFYDIRLIPGCDCARFCGKDFSNFIFEEEPKFMTLSSVSKAIKEDEKISGDNVSIVENKDHSMIIMLADGMGSGEEASVESEKVLDFMEKFIEAGFNTSKAFSMVNAAMAANDDDNSLTTLDVCELQLYEGEAEIIKAGAAISFCKRNNKVLDIQCDSLPLGSFSQWDPMSHSFEIMDGDMIIMMSDGISDSFDKDYGYKRLTSVISKYNTQSPKEMADYILQYAINCNGGRIRDDMTVVVVGIYERFNNYRLCGGNEPLYNK